ncbi:zinc finger CCCH domain-containing protein 53-like isoform X1 [Zingiber officinale]|uniref:zinc finger CCCH domain-containing protein 53-like isoform X1 n=2 Tax=Zingiber officinale TaxID=94328 RepID=UPI001C4D42C4|nr:zinc finger CCCH domain-containing protein 53-like isoform X1 [Zingiber officinale]XP_042417542.1 zinc finger CCCH domain-containing protein 53-like isoform X1 [Zingiber officinale]
MTAKERRGFNMDVYEATRVVMARIQSLDVENAAKIMGYVLIQEQGDKEMIRLAFASDALLHSVVLKARGDLGLTGPPLPSASPSFFSPRGNQNSSLFSSLAGVPFPTSFAPPPAFSRSGRSSDELRGFNELLSSHGGVAAGDPTIDEFQLQDHLSFLSDPATSDRSHPIDNKSSASGDLSYPDVLCRSSSGGIAWVPFPYRVGWEVNVNHHRRSWSATDLPLRSYSATGGIGCKPCPYYSRGYCKEGSACRFLHGLPEDTITAAAQSQRISGASQLTASAFPYSPIGSLPSSPSTTTKSLDFLLQQQQNECQRAAAAAAAAALLRIPIERSDLAAMVNPGSRQIYLTFPSDSTFTEEDVSNYFSIYGPVQVVRIPYQQKRMFGFVTFSYPETVKLILAKGNPHFVCDARVLVKPYKEKGKVLDKYRKQQQGERGDFYGCTTPTGIESRGDPYDLQLLGARVLYNSGSQELLRRKLEEELQAIELQREIKLQARRLMSLQLHDLKNRSLCSSPPASINFPTSAAPACISIPTVDSSRNGSCSSSSQEHSPIGGAELKLNTSNYFSSNAVNSADQNEDSSVDQSIDHNLPNSPFASPTKLSIINAADPFTLEADMASYKSCFSPMKRLSSSSGAIGM